MIHRQKAGSKIIELAHRMLKYIPGQGFTYNRFKPLDCDAVLIDEASTIDINLVKDPS